MRIKPNYQMDLLFDSNNPSSLCAKICICMKRKKACGCNERIGDCTMYTEGGNQKDPEQKRKDARQNIWKYEQFCVVCSEVSI